MVLKSKIRPLVTIVIPLYNNEKFIAQTIESILKQSYDNFEILIYDDNSNDRSCEIVSSFRDERLVLTRGTSRLGPEGNWNRCLSQINGEYYVLVPGDDILYPGYLEKLVAVLENDIQKKIAIVGCARKIIDPKGHVMTQRTYPGRSGVYSLERVLKRIFLFGTNVIGEPSSALMRSSVAKKVASYRANPGYMIDLDFWIRALDYGDFYFLNEPLSGFRISKNSWSAQIGFGQRNEFMYFINKLISERNLHPTILEMFAVNLSSWVALIGRMLFFASTHLRH